MPEMSLYIRSVHRYALPSWMHGMRHASSKHLWPGSEAFLNIEGIPHFNGDNEVDRLARKFLNEQPYDGQPFKTYGDQISVLRSFKNAHKFKSDIKDRREVGNCDIGSSEQLRGEYTKKVWDHRDYAAPNIDSFITHCTEEVSKLENSGKYCQSLEKYALGEVKEVMAKQELSVKSLELVNNNQNNIKITPQSNANSRQTIESAMRPSNKYRTKDIKKHHQKNHQHNLQTVNKENMHRVLNKSNDICTYKPFQTIELPALNTNKEETKLQKAIDHTEYDQTTYDLAKNKVIQQNEVQTIFDDTKSRILMRYALMKALKILESGGTHCKAKIILKTPKKN